MDLSLASIYALQALALLAAQAGDRLVPSYVIAQTEDLEERSLLKVLRVLVRARILRSQDGPSGGYRLARTADQITLLEVLEAVDGPARCQVPLMRNGGLQERLQGVCEEMTGQTKQFLGRVRIADLAGAAE
jgi:Rrf2 family protein